MQATCEKIQHCGQGVDIGTGKDLSSSETEKSMSKDLKRVRSEYKEARIALDEILNDPDA